MKAILFFSVLTVLGVVASGQTAGHVATEERDLLIVASGDTILSGADIRKYDISTYEITLTDRGVAKWGLHAQSQTHEGREIPKLSRLTGRIFQLYVAGELVCEGRFGSMFSSTISPGLTLYDSLIRPGHDTLRLEYWSNDEQAVEDPRVVGMLVEYFRRSGKLVTEP